MTRPIENNQDPDVIKAKRQRQTQRLCAVQKRKRELLRSGQDSCEVCGWRAPAFLKEISGRAVFPVNLHHVLPVACGGTEEPENLVLLCPNHHAIADVLSGRLNKGRGNKTNAFITDRNELLTMLRLIDSDPAQWEKEMRERFSREQGEIVNLLSELFR